MDLNIVEVIIGAAGGSIVTLLFTRILNQNLLHDPSSRLKLLDGRWEGPLRQNKGPDKGQPIVLGIVGTLQATNREIGGGCEISFFYQNQYVTRCLSFEFGLFFHDFLVLIYKEKEGQLQFGAAVLKLSPNGQYLVGYSIGFGPETNEMVGGRIELRKSELIIPGRSPYEETNMTSLMRRLRQLIQRWKS